MMKNGGMNTALTIGSAFSVLLQCQSAVPLPSVGGFLFVTFKGEQNPLSEQVYFNVSRDGRNWTALNDGNPVLVSTLGEKGVRDPFLLRAHDNKRFYLIATDLSWARNRDVGRSLRAGSRSIVVWESADLVNWSAPRLVAVAPEDAGCAWAPEAVYDEETGDYLVFWASTTRRDHFSKHRIWAARTKDFRTFSAPFVYIEKPTGIIDTTIVRDGRRYYRVTKDEKVKTITFETSEKLMGPWRDVPDFSLAKLSGHEGPACYIVEPASPGRPATWCLILDHYAKGRGYQPFVTHDLASGRFEPVAGFSFPFPFRHGTVVPVTSEEYQRLLAAYPNSLSANDRLNFGHALIPDLVADPSIVDIDGTFYCYATTDGWGQHLATSGTPVVWTSKDFVNWSFEGSSFPPDFDLKYWAPSTIVRRNGRYYSFPTLDGKITAVVADSPLGPFLAPDGGHVTKSTLRPYPIEQRHAIDAEVFVDDDSQAYMVLALHRLYKLKPDLLTPDGPVITIPAKRQGYSEGPFLAKRKGIYYYFYTLGGDEAYSYAYMMSRVSPLGPWEAPEHDLIAESDHTERVIGPGHGCFFHPQDSDTWYFVYLEYGRGGTTRQIYADRMTFNPDGTIQSIKLTKAGVGSLRPVADASPNLALGAAATASSILGTFRVQPRKFPGLDRVETYAPANAVDGLNGTRWHAAAGDCAPWFQVDLGAPRAIRRTEAYFVKPAAGHAYRLDWSIDGRAWQPYGGHDEVIRRSPHRDEKAVRARFLKLTILNGEPGLWEFRVY